jgi:chromatin segregation and condensation protein Rec8/ScpA/Scc1 (kleisin family)
MTALQNFGAVFTFAIEMEGQVHDYFAGLGDDDTAEAASKRIKKLERARREYVVEITLEPIDDLDTDTYQLNTEDTSSAGKDALTATAKQFYTDAAPKINVRQAQRILERCGKQYDT